MAAINGFNTTTDNDIVRTETINPLIIPAANYMRVSQALAWVAPANGTAHKWPRWDAPSAAPAAHTETDEFSAANYGTSVESVNGDVVGTYAFSSDKLQAVSANAPIGVQIANMAEELRNKIDLDILATFVGATNASDNTGSNLSLDLWETALAAFMAQKVQGPRFAFVGSVNQIRDLRKAIRQAGGGALVMQAGLEVFNGLPNRGYLGHYQGIEIYQGNTTQADGTNDAGGFCSCAELGAWSVANSFEEGGQYQAFSGLGLAKYRLNGSFEINMEVEREAQRVGAKLVCTAMYGASITADHLVRAFISLKAAA
jgi:hypothetical protein